MNAKMRRLFRQAKCQRINLSDLRLSDEQRAEQIRLLQAAQLIKDYMPEHLSPADAANLDAPYNRQVLERLSRSK